MTFSLQKKSNIDIQGFIKQRFSEASKQTNVNLIRKTLIKLAFVGAFAHTSFIFLFVTLGVTELAFLNIFSVLIWTSAYYFCSKNHFSIALITMVFEIVIHAIIVTLIIGNQASFHFYLWPAMGLLLLAPSKNKNLYTGFSVLIVGIFIYLHTLEPLLYKYDLEINLLAISWMNIFFSAIPFIFSIRYFQSKRIASDKKLFEIANTDEFTSTFNRRFIYSLLRDQESALVHINNYAIILCDIDNLNIINRDYGYSEGEKMIIGVANTIERHLSGNDLYARWGGQEFLMIIDNTNHQCIKNLINSIQLTLCRNTVKPAETMGDLTLSYGVAFQKDADRFAIVLQRADMLLNQAKNEGKNRAVIEE